MDERNLAVLCGVKSARGYLKRDIALSLKGQYCVRSRLGTARRGCRNEQCSGELVGEPLLLWTIEQHTLRSAARPSVEQCVGELVGDAEAEAVPPH
jgi:hypothetical protein